MLNELKVLELLCEPYKVGSTWIVRILAEKDNSATFEDAITKPSKEEILQVQRGFVYRE